MPIPKPHDGESEKDFIGRCMGDDVMVSDYSDQKQRLAVCYSAFDRKVGKAAISTMRLYGAIEKVEPLDDGTVRVHGIASTEAVDDQGEIVKGDAMRAAIPDYMRFPALREMHQLTAAGTTLEADVGNDNITRIVAHVVDPVAVLKVKNQVYRGFSIGGRVTQREPGNSRVITGLVWNELSLVDRPANPEAVLDVWKASDMPTPGAATAAPFNPPLQLWNCGVDNHRHLAKADALKCQEKRAADGVSIEQAKIDTALKAVEAGSELVAESPVVEQPVDKPPVIDQSVVKADDSKKPYGDVTYADPGYQSDKKKRYPIDTEGHIRAAWNYINKPKNSGKYSSEHLSSIKSRIVAAWKRKIDKDGPPSAKSSVVEMRKALWNIGQLAMLCHGLEEYCDSLAVERAVEGDDSDQPEKLHAIVLELMGFLRDQVAEDTQEMAEGMDADEDDMLTEGWHLDPSTVAAIVKALTNVGAEKLVSEIEKRGARHNRVDQAVLDTVAYATNRAMSAGVAKRGDLILMADAHKVVLDLGATNLGAEGREMLTNSNPTQGSPTQHSTVDTSKNPITPVPNPTGAVPPIGKTSGGLAAIDAIEKAGGGHVALMNAAHDLLCAVSDGVTCKEGARPGRHSASDVAMMCKAHDFMTGIDGVKCSAVANEVPGGAPTVNSSEPEGQGTVSSAPTGKASGSEPVAPDEPMAKVFEDLLTKYLTPVVEAQPAPDSIAKTVNDAIAAALAPLADKLAAISSDVTKIKETPLPPVTMARVPNSISKSGDNGPNLTSDMSDEALAKAFAGKTKEEQSLILIRASRAQPIAIPGITDGPVPSPVTEG